MLEPLDPVFSTPLVAAAAITWTTKTFYIAAAIVQTIVILVGFRLLQVDPEQNTFVGAVLAAVVANAAAFFLRDAGLFGVLVSGSLYFVLLVAITSGEALKSAMMFLIVIASYGAMGQFITDRTPLNVNDVAGIPRVIMTGGLEAEPITEDEADKMTKPGGG